MEKLGGHHLNQVDNINITNMGTNWCFVTPDMMHHERHTISSVVFLPQIHNPNLIMRNMRQIPTEGHSTK